MTGYAAAHATWGIPGPVFAVAYGVAVALVLAGTFVHWRRLFAGPKGYDPKRLGPYEIACLTGVDPAHAAVGALRAAGAIDVTPDKRLVRAGPLPAGATPLDAAVYGNANGHLVTQWSFGGRAVDAAAGQLRDGLVRDGLVAPPATRRAARAGAKVLLVLGAVGIVRWIAGALAGRPDPYLGIELLVVAVAAGLLFAAVPRHTWAAWPIVRKLRGTYPHLAPQHSPAMATYGPRGAALSVALFGGAALWAMDPSFASAAGIPQHSFGDSSGGSGCGGCGCGGCGG
jgi:uncharacterized protein (TIGR04222 family)